jgi:hypothetical protein
MKMRQEEDTDLTMTCIECKGKADMLWNEGLCYHCHEARCGDFSEDEKYFSEREDI